jgi:peptidyl-prolyl cis-trans isomerase SurA
LLKINILFTILAVIISTNLFADNHTKEIQSLDGIAAIVNEGVVLRSQFIEALELIKQQADDQNMQLPPEDILREQVLERLIITELQMQRAKMIGLTEQISDQYLNDSIQQIADQNGISFEEMPELLAKDNIEYADFREGLREDLTLRELKGLEVLRNIRVSEREIAQCKLDIESNAVINADWQLSHILLSIPESASSNEISSIEEKALEIYELLEESKDFRELAALHSDGPTALQGGSLGWLNGQQIPSIFVNVLQNMEAGEVTRPFRAPNSYHIVKVDDVRSSIERSEINQSKIRHILITPNEIIDDATAKQRLNDAIEKINQGVDFGVLAKLLSDDVGTANLGGDLDWQETSNFTSEFKKAADLAKIGEVTEPFSSQFGWHILEVIDRRVYDNTEEIKEMNCVNRIRISKQEEETLLWLQEMRDEAYVDSRI